MPDDILSKKNNEINLPKSFSKKDVFYRYSIVFFFAFVLIIGSGIMLWYIHSETNNINKNAAKNDVKNFALSVSKFRDFYSKVILPAAREHGMTITHDYINKAGTLPLPATFAKDFGHSLSSGESNLKVKLYSDLPFPWRHENIDAFEREALATLKKNPTQPIWAFETLDGQPVLRYARADVMTESCVGCHNTYPGTPKGNWKVGDVRGVLEVIRPMSAIESNNLLKNSFLMMLVLILSMVMLIFFVLRKLSATIKIAYDSYITSKEANKKLTTEILQRKKITHHLRASDIKMRAIVNSVEEVIIVINKIGLITECNHVIESMFGYKKEEVLGQNITLLMTGSHKSSHDGYIQKYISGHIGSVMGQNRVFFALRKNGEKFPIELFVNDARVGKNIMFTGTIRDITHRRAEEEAIANAHQAAIDSANMKSEFLANMSHEIRTPMNGVIGMTEMLLLSKLDEEQTELAQTVKESAASLLVIINDILDFSKIEAGKLSIKKHSFNLLHMIEAAIDLLAKSAEQKHIDIAFFIEKNVPINIYSDAGRMRQILINLLNNALKFTDRGHVTLHVSMKNTQHLHFKIIDTGAGIDKKDQITLFDLFSQVDGSSSREHGGTGLGLAICKQLTELMGGEIGVKSIKNGGSTFWFTIEIEAQKKPHIPYIETPANVLMMNSSPLLSCYYQQQMQDWGMFPTIVNNLNHFMAQLHQEEYQLLAIDADNIFVDAQDPSAFLAIIDSIRRKTVENIVLYAGRAQLNRLETVSLGKNIHLISKPIKHTVLKVLLNQLKHEDTDTVLISSMNKKIEPILAPNLVSTTESEPTLEVTKSATEATPTKDAKTEFHVLLAEDNRVNQMVAIAVLGKHGCKVTIANNGKEALQHAEREKFDAIFMDCQMPTMDGYEATRSIRQFSKTHSNNGIPIIAFTANAMKDDDVKCKDAGMDDYLSKPIDMEELKAVFSRWREQMLAHKKIRLEH
ncbi:MAG: response regulator [Cocleimonas sp.]|nr:response regulator [Cocleimonas sp.]